MADCMTVHDEQPVKDATRVHGTQNRGPGRV